MKCPDCSRNHPKKYGQRCNCGYTFVFNPERDQGWTDGKFIALIKRAGHNGTYYFTKNQLLTYARKRRKLSAFQKGSVLAAGVIITVILTMITHMVLVGLVACASFVLICIICISKGVNLSRNQLDGLIDKWLRSGKKIDKLVTETSLNKPPPEWKEKDIYDYGFEKILIVQNDLQVDVLVLNNFHIEQRVLIASANGYPKYIHSQLNNIIAGNPDLKILVIHDTMTRQQGRKFIRQLKMQLKCESCTVIDLGLYENHAEWLCKTTKSKPDNPKEPLPMDYIPFPLLATLLTLSIEKNVGFSKILDEVSKKGYDNGGATGDFG